MFFVRDASNGERLSVDVGDRALEIDSVEVSVSTCDLSVSYWTWNQVVYLVSVVLP